MTWTLPDGRRVVLDRDKVTLGRLPECELALADRERQPPARRSPAGGGWDLGRRGSLGSTNGTKVNGVKNQRGRASWKTEMR